MKFSVLMSVYYKENPKYFFKAVESVIKQTIKPAEVVIVKDGLLTVELEKACKDLVEASKSFKMDPKAKFEGERDA